MMDPGGQGGAAARGPDPEASRLRPGGRGRSRRHEAGGVIVIARPGGVVGRCGRNGGVPADHDPPPGSRTDRLVGTDRRHMAGFGHCHELDGHAVNLEFQRGMGRGEEQPLRLAEHLRQILAGDHVVREIDGAAATGRQFVDGTPHRRSLGRAGPARIEPPAADHQGRRFAPLRDGHGLRERVGGAPADSCRDGGMGRLRDRQGSVDRRVEGKHDVGHVLHPPW